MVYEFLKLASIAFINFMFLALSIGMVHELPIDKLYGAMVGLLMLWCILFIITPIPKELTYGE